MKIYVLFHTIFLINRIDSYLNYKIYNASPKNIITTFNLYNSINNDFAILLKDNLYSPFLYKESIYIPIICVLLVNEILENKYKKRNDKLDKIEFNGKDKIKVYVKNIFLLFNLVLVRDIENAI